MTTHQTLLEVRNLSIEFHTKQGILQAVDDLSFSVYSGQTLGVVGESGCGKSVTALSLLGLVAEPPGRVRGGSILFENENILGLTEAALQKIRGNHISMIFQEPMTSLNPVFSTGEQVAEVIRSHQGKSRLEALQMAVEMFRLVGISSPETRVHNYPHQMSGGMRQRVMIAMALVCKPKLLIADEPTTALDVTIQAQILKLLRSLQKEIGMSILFITHDLAVVSESCDQVMVMYAGRMVEHGPVRDVLRTPSHPYTVGLMKCLPGEHGVTRGQALYEIPGMVPTLFEPVIGCAFYGRCPSASDICAQFEPPLIGQGRRRVRCHHPMSNIS